MCYANLCCGHNTPAHVDSSCFSHGWFISTRCDSVDVSERNLIYFTHAHSIDQHKIRRVTLLYVLWPRYWYRAAAEDNYSQKNSNKRFASPTPTYSTCSNMFVLEHRSIKGTLHLLHLQR